METITKNGKVYELVEVEPINEYPEFDNWFNPVYCLEQVTKNWYVLQYVPDKLKTEKLCKVAVEQDGEALQFVPEKLRTEKLCKVAVGKNGDALMYVPEQLKTESICRVAVKHRGYALKSVKDKATYIKLKQEFRI